VSVFVPIAIFGWPLVVLVLFTVLPPRRAIIVGMLGAWLFLPMAGYQFAGLPDITKMTVTSMGIFLGAIIFDPGRFAHLRWHWTDLAIIGWVSVPLPAALSSGYGAYEGVSGILNQLVAWGLPYAIGRLYFSDLEGLRELALGIFIGGLVYVPFVLFEVKMSPQLHTWIYGFHQHSFGQTKRMGGWRPTVFMQHGLAVAMFMGTTAVCGLWMWNAGRKRILQLGQIGLPMWALALGLFTVAALCRSAYALILMVAGTIALFAGRLLNTRLILAGMLAIAPLYVTARTVGGWDAQQLRDIAAIMGAERDGSLALRLDSEDSLWRWIRSDALLGRGRLAGLIVHGQDEFGRFVPDGLWLIALGKYGLVGLVSMFGVLLLPPAVYVWRHRARELVAPQMAGATALMLVLILYAMDNLLNAMVNPVYLLAAGGLAVCRAGADSERRYALKPNPLWEQRWPSHVN
jgi:hypothetical protein